MEMRKARREVGSDPTEDDRAWLRSVEEWVRSEYPGFEGATLSAATLEATITELQEASKNRTIRATPVGKALREYLDARTWAQSEAEAWGYTSFRTAKGASDLRTYLRDFADSLSMETPGFQRVWFIFEGELADEQTEEEAGRKPVGGTTAKGGV
jgi:hypothetical protein